MAYVFNLQDHKDWLLTLKAGDEVAVNYKKNSLSKDFYRRHTIKTVTAGGRIRIDKGNLLNDSGAWYETYGSYCRIQPMTPEIAEHIERRRIVELIGTTKWDEVPSEVLRIIETSLLFGKEAEHGATIS